MSEKTFRVVAVRIDNEKRRILKRGMKKEVAESVATKLAVLRRGIEVEFFTVEEE